MQQHLWQHLNHALAGVVHLARHAIVQIHNGRHGGGTGVVVRADGLLLTNAHVLKKRYPHVTLADGRRLCAQVVGYDAEEDLAALTVEAEALAALPFGDSRAARPGDLVQAVGHPWGVVGAATAGVLVSLEADWQTRHPFQRDWLVADFHLGPGNSGGPLLDAGGCLLGINTMLMGTGLGVAVPSHRAQAFLQRILPEQARDATRRASTWRQ